MIEFRVDGTPTPQGSKTAVMINGRAVIIDAGTTTSRKKHKAWRKAVHDAAQAFIDSDPIWTGAIDEPVGIVVAFAFPTVASDKYRRRHVSKPDIDKLIRSVLDALTTSGLLIDDSRVCAISATKRHSDDVQPGARIEVHRYGEQEAQDRKRAIHAARLARHQM